jgi:MGT family glycosyltransferase
VRPLILVSYSTSFQDQAPALQRVADAVADLPARVLLTLGKAISADELQLPDNVVAETFVPHAAVLPHASLVVTHAGHGTVMAAVTAGVPLVCTPMGRDQHAVGACVERRGLGVVAPVTASPEDLRRTIGAALGDDALRGRARNFAAGLDVEAGLQRALTVLETLRAPSSAR